MYHPVTENILSRAALLYDDLLIDIGHTFGSSNNMIAVLSLLMQREYAEEWNEALRGIVALPPDGERILEIESVQLVSPLIPTSIRDFDAFEQHALTMRERRGLELSPEWYEVPIFQFVNHHAIFGPDETIPQPRQTNCLDFEVELAAIIGRPGRDIPISEADSYIAGYTIMNDWTARDTEAQELKVGRGPTKSKDFATSLGPWIVTPDELADRREGLAFNLNMIVRRNDVELARGNMKTLHYSFAEMIAHASADTLLIPGDVIGSGGMEAGCLLELGPENVGGWLRPGDVIELEVERLGVLRNTIRPPSGATLTHPGAASVSG